MSDALDKERIACAQERQGLLAVIPSRRERLRAISRLLGAVDGQAILEISRDDALSAYLRQAHHLQGCRWHSAALTPAALERLRCAVPSHTHLAEDPTHLPFENGAYDAVILSDVLEYTPDVEKLIAECHRILKASGRLIICVRRRESWCPLQGLRELFGLVPKTNRPLRPGYTQAELFAVVKDGFDVQESTFFSRFFTEGAEVFAQLMSGMSSDLDAPEYEEPRRLQRTVFINRLFTLFFWVSRVLDTISPFLRGHYLAMRAKRRIWVPRRTVTLRDGRSIAEAALQSKIGTAVDLT